MAYVIRNAKCTSASKRGRYDGEIGVCVDKPVMKVCDAYEDKLLEVDIPEEMWPVFRRNYPVGW